MNVTVQNLKDESVEIISQHVKTYGSMTIPEMLFIDEQLEKASGKQFNLVKLLEKLTNEAHAVGDTVNAGLLSRVTNNFSLYKEICGVPNI